MTTKPKIELRKVSENKSLSEETPAYTAQVWVDGVYVADVSNHGHGGCDMQHPRPGVSLADLDKRIAATYPPHKYTAGGEVHTFDLNLEMVCHDLLAQREIDKIVDRALKTKVMWTRDGKVMEVSLKKIAANKWTRDQFIANVRAKEPKAVFLHDMPRAEVTKLLVS